MQRYTETYRDTQYRTLETKFFKDSIVFEGRDELLQVMLSLRKSGNKNFAKKLWRLHTGFKRCPCCHNLSIHFVRAGYHSYHRGWNVPICEQCYDGFAEEYWKIKRGGDKDQVSDMKHEV